VIPSPSPDQRNEDACRRAAAQLQHDHGQWLVMWGCYTRSYIAFPLFAVPRGIVLTASSPGEMTAKIQRAERSAAAQVPPPRSPMPGPQRVPGVPGQRMPGPQEWPGPRGRQGPQDWPGRTSLPASGANGSDSWGVAGWG
jgi:hypothetical protein